MNNNLRISTHYQLYEQFLSKLFILQQKHQFDSDVHKILSEPLIVDKLVFNIPKMIDEKKHLEFFSEIAKFFSLSTNPQQFSILRNQLEQSLHNISGFHLAFQNSVHNDLICQDRDFYISRPQPIMMHGVERMATNSINHVAVFELIFALVNIMKEFFPELLNQNNAKVISSTLTGLKLSIESDLTYLSQLSLITNLNFLDDLMKYYFNRIIDTEYIVKIFRFLSESKLPNISLSLLKNLKIQKMCRLLLDKDITSNEREMIVEHNYSTKLIEKLTSGISSLWDKITLSKNLLDKIMPYYYEHPSNEKFFKYIQIKDMKDEELFDYLIKKWLSENKYSLYRTLADKGYVSKTENKILRKIDQVLNNIDPNSNKVEELVDKGCSMVWGRILNFEYLNDQSFLETVLFDKNHKIFCHLPYLIVEVVMQKLNDTNQDLKYLVNCFVKIILWYEKRGFSFNVTVRDDLIEFANLMVQKSNYNLRDSFQRYTYQQKIIQWFKKNQLEIADAPLIQLLMEHIRKDVSFDGDQLCFDSNYLIIHHKNEQLITKDRWGYRLFDKDGYQVWCIERDPDRDSHDKGDIIHDGYLFVLKPESLNIYRLADGEKVKELTQIDHIPIKYNLSQSVRSFREPLTADSNRWYFVTQVEKISKLEYFTFNPETLEFISDGKDENFPTTYDGSSYFFGTTLYYREGGFCRKQLYSLYSLTEKKFLESVKDRNDIEHIASLGNALTYIDKDKKELHIFLNDTDFIVPLTKDQFKGTKLYHVKQLDEDFIFIKKNVLDYKTKSILFIDQTKQISLIEIPEDLQTEEFYPTKQGVVCESKGELIFLQSQSINHQKISPTFYKDIGKNQIIKYDGFLNGYHVFHKEWVKKDCWNDE